MNRNQLKNLWRLYSAPVMLVIFGLILVFSPDSAIALVTKLLAWIFIAFGVISIITTLSDREAGNPVKWLWPVAALLVGGYFLRNPLVLANVLGRVIGAIIFFEGLDDLKKSRSKILPTITMAVGVILFLLPRTLTSTWCQSVCLLAPLIGVQRYLSLILLCISC